MVKEQKKINPPHSKLHLVRNNYEITWLTGIRYIFKIPEKFNMHAEARQWVDDNCSYPVVFNTTAETDRVFYFYSEDDLMRFKLVWAGVE